MWDEFLNMTDDQRALAEKMSDISEDTWCAAWLVDLEFDLWRMLQGGPRKYGMGEVTEDEVGELRDLSARCGGWVAWDQSAEDIVFVPMGEWFARFAKHKGPR